MKNQSKNTNGVKTGYGWRKTNMKKWRKTETGEIVTSLQVVKEVVTFVSAIALTIVAVIIWVQGVMNSVHIYTPYMIVTMKLKKYYTI